MARLAFHRNWPIELVESFYRLRLIFFLSSYLRESDVSPGGNDL